MAVYLRGPHWWYDFQMDGERHRGPCGKSCTSKTRAKQIEDNERAKVIAGVAGPVRKAPILADFAPAYLEYKDGATTGRHLAQKTRDYYHNGIRMLEGTTVWAMRLDRISTEIAEMLAFPGVSPSTANNALRTLRNVLSFAASRKIIRSAPTINLLEENERTIVIEPWLEDLVLECASSPLREVVIVMLDSFLRPAEVCALRWENVLWDKRRILIKESKTKKGKRVVGMTERMQFELQLRKQGNESPWVFPSTGAKSRRAAACGHTLPGSLNKMWASMKARALKAIAERDLPPWPDGLVLYSCRHTGATHYSEAVGNITKVADRLGHADTRTTRRYLHHDDDSAEVMNRHNKHRLTLVEKKRA